MRLRERSVRDALVLRLVALDRSIEDIAEAIQAEWAKVPRPLLTLVL